MSRFHCFHRLMFSFLLLCTGACGDTSTIPGTEIPDTEVNRSVVSAVERFRVSMVMRDAAGIMAATHESYYDTAGTDDPGDDVSFEELGPILRQRMAQLQSVRFTIDYLEVSVDKDRAVVRVWIDASFRMGLGEAVTTELGIEPDAKTESRYARMQDFNMFELVQEGDGWLITSGL
jgi:hypothetical protein